jgi:hypothetical protein
MDENLGCRFLPSPKRGCALPSALPAAPAAFALIYLHVFWRKRMAIAASTWYRAGAGCDRLAGVVGGEANHFGFGGSKARPRYQLYICEVNHLARSARRAICFLAGGVGAM